MPSATTSTPPRRALVSRGLCGLILVFWAIDTALLGLPAITWISGKTASAPQHTQTVLWEWRLSWTERLSLLGLEFCLLAAVVAVAALPMIALSKLVAKWTDRRRATRILARLALVAVVTLLLLLFFGSWATYISTGQFLDREGWFFFTSQAAQVMQWVPPTAMIGVPTAAVALAAAICYFWPRRPERRRRVLPAATLALLVVSAISALAFRPSSTRSGSVTVEGWVGMSYTIDEYYRKVRECDSGPAVHGLSDVYQWAKGDPMPLSPNPDLPVIRRPIVSMNDYLAAAPVGARKYNIVFVLVESLRADQLRANGCDRDVMPNIDAVARDGRAYVDTYSQASHTNYANLCPMSGHYPLRSVRTHVYPEHPTYPRVLIYDILKARGYRVGMFSGQNETWGGMLNYLDTGAFEKMQHVPTWTGLKYIPRDVHFAAWIKQTKAGGQIDDRYTIGEAIKWIDQSAAPFFVYLNMQNSHFPYEVPEDFDVKFGPRTVDFEMAFNYWPREKASIVKGKYADSLRYVDMQLGRLIGHLKSIGRWDNTIFVLTGDHGEAFYEHHFASHANVLLEEDIRVPLVIRAPGLSHAIDPRPAQHIDVPPTVLDLLGLPPHPAYQGQSLLAAADSKHCRYIVAHTALAHQYAIVRDGYKLIHDARTAKTVLYHLPTDPAESKDLSATNPALAQELLDRLTTWRAHQIEYYTKTKLHTAAYPPVFAP